MVAFIRRWLQIVFFCCMGGGLVGGSLLLLTRHDDVGGGLIGIALLAVFVCIPLDFVLSWLAKPRPVARGFDVKLVMPTDDVKHE